MDNKLVLIVDDDAAVREMVRTALERSVGARTAVATNGDEALQRVQELKPDLILLDLMMPRRDGFKVTRQLKSDPETRAIPIIVMTAWGLAKFRKRPLEITWDDFINKPFELDDLVGKVREYLLSAS